MIESSLIIARPEIVNIRSQNSRIDLEELVGPKVRPLLVNGYGFPVSSCLARR